MVKETFFPCPLSTEDLTRLSGYISKGLRGITFCSHGIARSWNYADFMTRQGIPTAFFEGGFEILEGMEESKRRTVINQLKMIPDRWAVLNTKEIKRYADLLRRVQVCLVNDKFS